MFPAASEFDDIDGHLDKMSEECGVFGYYSNKLKPVGSYTFYGLFAIQHRGQESAGITINKDGEFTHLRGLGLVNDVFDQNQLMEKKGYSAIGHVRYSTTGNTVIENCQPLLNHSILGYVSVAHNGNLVNHESIRYDLESQGIGFSSSIDSEVIVKLIVRHSKLGSVEAVKKAVNTIVGAFALVILIDNKLIGVRDPYGIRPLVLGETADGDYVLASESCALDAIDAKIIRDIEAGEIVIIDENGPIFERYCPVDKFSPCSFEYIYFARPDSRIDSIDVYEQRLRAGKSLARQLKVEADLVIGVPDSGLYAAMGYAEESGIPYSLGLVKSKYTGRSFILPSQEMRSRVVRTKLNPINSVIKGKRIVIVDDSLVRGTTARVLVSLLKNAGAKEIHFRSASPKVLYPCYFGIDTNGADELIAARMDTNDICKFIGADTLDFLELDNMKETLGKTCKDCCVGCFTGKYPINVKEVTK